MNKSLDEAAAIAAKPMFAEAIKAKAEAIRDAKKAAEDFDKTLRDLSNSEDEYAKKVQHSIDLLRERNQLEGKVDQAKVKAGLMTPEQAQGAAERREHDQRQSEIAIHEATREKFSGDINRLTLQRDELEPLSARESGKIKAAGENQKNAEARQKGLDDAAAKAVEGNQSFWARAFAGAEPPVSILSMDELKTQKGDFSGPRREAMERELIARQNTIGAADQNRAAIAQYSRAANAPALIGDALDSVKSDLKTATTKFKGEDETIGNLRDDSALRDDAQTRIQKIQTGAASGPIAIQAQSVVLHAGDISSLQRADQIGRSVLGGQPSSPQDAAFFNAVADLNGARGATTQATVETIERMVAHMKAIQAQLGYINSRLQHLGLQVGN